MNSAKNNRTIYNELKATIGKQHNIIDSVLAPLLFLIMNLWLGLQVAIWAALSVSIAVVGWRLLRRQDLQFAFSGVFGTLLAIWFAQRFGKAEGFFIPGIIAAGITSLVAIVSVLLKKTVGGLFKSDGAWLAAGVVLA